MVIALQVLAPIAATLGGLVVGTGISWTSPVIPRMPFHISRSDISWMVSVRAIGSLIFALPAGALANKIGRKPSLVLSGVPSLISWFIIAFTRSTPPLLVARFLMGVGTAFFNAVTPIYVAEVADKKHRGWLTVLMALMLNVGQLFEYCIGPFVSYTALALMSSIFPTIFILMMLFMPESPMYYIMKDRLSSAQKSISRLRGEGDTELQKEELRRTISHVIREQEERSNIKDLILHKGPRKAMVIVLALFGVQHLSGLMAILMYAEEIFEKSNSTVINPEIAPIIIAAFQLIASMACAIFTDKLGRRPLLIISTIGCGISLVLAGIFNFVDHVSHRHEHLELFPLIGIVGYLVMFSAGIGPLTFVVEGEMFPPNMKALALSLCSMYVGFLDFLVTKTFPGLQEMWGQFVLFWLFALVAFLGAFFVYFFVPETKGQALADIVTQMKGSSYQAPQTPKESVEPEAAEEPQEPE